MLSSLSSPLPRGFLCASARNDRRQGAIMDVLSGSPSSSPNAGCLQGPATAILSRAFSFLAAKQRSGWMLLAEIATRSAKPDVVAGAADLPNYLTSLDPAA